MGKSFKEQLDFELTNLEADIYWDKKRNEATLIKLEERMIAHNKRRNKLQPFPYVAIFVASTILFLLIRMEFPLLHTFQGINAMDEKTADLEELVIITAEEQKRVENKNTVFLSEEAGIPYSLYTLKLSSLKITGEPKISATKVKDSILVNADYPLSSGSYLSIYTEKKQKGIQGNGRNSIVKKELEMTINNHLAILIHEKNDLKLMITTNNYQYTITGVNNEYDLISIAEMIEFY
ncbi:hypothetical protein [Niallia sp.]|uniref:hypothetical protein n=1 Tax=Niallia sp. TaxID=2837523 RepID=UPI002899CC39|nr:hypothetical protein [Niallia sp.]